jgi:hypothetical protein
MWNGPVSVVGAGGELAGRVGFGRRLPDRGRVSIPGGAPPPFRDENLVVPVA